MLGAMERQKRRPELFDAPQPLKLFRVDQFPDEMIIDVYIAMNRIFKYFRA
jgi:hypothetical protein